MPPTPQKSYVYKHADMTTEADQAKRRGIRVPPREILDSVKLDPITASSTQADVKALAAATAAIPDGQGFWHDTQYDGDYWCIYGHEYDFTPFLLKHPGGQMMLKLGQECDCTCMFETVRVGADGVRHMLLLAVPRRSPLPLPPSRATPLRPTHPQYHVMKNHKTMLAMIEPYRMHKTLEGAPVPKPDVKQNDFLEACKAMMKDHFVTGPGAKERYPAEHKPSWNRVLWCFLPAALMMVTFWSAWQAGKWWSFTIAIAHWVLGVNTSHDGGHFAMSKRPAVNWFYLLLTEPLGFHPFVWLHQHDKMHHQNPNDAGRDVDLDHFHPMRLSPRQSHEYKNLVVHLLRYSYSSFYICVGYPLWWIGIKLPFPALKALPIEKQFKTPSMVALGAFCCAVSLYVCLQPWYHCVLGDYSIFKALAFSTFPWLLTAAVFIAFTQVNHLQVS